MMDFTRVFEKCILKARESVFWPGISEMTFGKAVEKWWTLPI